MRSARWRTFGERTWSWLGFGARPELGLSIDDRSLVMAVVCPDTRRIGAVSSVSVLPGTVIGDQILDVDVLADAVRAGATALELADRQVIHVSLPWCGVAEPGVVAFDPRPVVDSAPADPTVVARIRVALDRAGLVLGRHEPVITTVVRIAALSIRPGEHADAVARAGWLEARMSVTPDRIDARVRRNPNFVARPEIRWGATEIDPGLTIDPFRWPRRIGALRPVGLLAAAAALIPDRDAPSSGQNSKIGEPRVAVVRRSV